MKNNSNTRFNIIRKKRNRSKVPRQPVKTLKTTGQKSQDNQSKVPRQPVKIYITAKIQKKSYLHAEKS